MKPTLLLTCLSLIPASFATTIYLAGDSTMAVGGGGNGTDGWGDYISPYLKTNYTISNHAIAGRSARSFTREGRFATIATLLTPSDWVIIEFGHNDGGSLTPTDNGRTDCPGTSTEICYSEYDGVNETILTFPAYLENASQLFLSKGANVLIASQTPENPWETGTFEYTPTRFVGYAEIAAQVAGVEYVDHGAYVASIYDTLGEEEVDGFFPIDHTHTSVAGAEVVAQAFLEGVVCGGWGLRGF
ncbi:putative rhamnogalacturonan acetylesterase [Aspergillus heteromorphus CBS 117.55]|uniref:Putative rhamnogalacturonan acetylesterase n=1 Tax=Aspergillus heteromorphus CBS 117.55 TaxID=1448321 RepID=A0A317WM81_9EURO|nr:putative rhamnogalacturonan acetylesterase [Aspergillus heteromorphus CBS 117.55]PWY87443.1 putative rhamnogalacturonan acetylesterase [Aspergillus heteromorphus CBS 117.55]